MVVLRLEPETAFEHTNNCFWRQVVGDEQIAALVRRLRAELSLNLELIDLFDSESVDGLVEFLGRASAADRPGGFDRPDVTT